MHLSSPTSAGTFSSPSFTNTPALSCSLFCLSFQCCSAPSPGSPACQIISGGMYSVWGGSKVGLFWGSLSSTRWLAMPLWASVVPLTCLGRPDVCSARGLRFINRNLRVSFGIQLQDWRGVGTAPLLSHDPVALHIERWGPVLLQCPPWGGVRGPRYYHLHSQSGLASRPAVGAGAGSKSSTSRSRTGGAGPERAEEANKSTG